MQTANQLALKSVTLNCISNLEIFMPQSDQFLSLAQSNGLIAILSKHTDIDDRDKDMFRSDDSSLLDEIQLAVYDGEVSNLHLACYAAQLIAICDSFGL
jgi:hypothetical protein